MKQSRRAFIIFSKHRRLTRLWQFFFTGWGLVMVAALVAGSLFTRQLIWTPISAINMTDIVSNQFKMTDATFAGIDKDGDPFRIRAASARQEYDSPDIIFLDRVSGTITHTTNKGVKSTKKITANTGQYDRMERKIRLIGNVHVDSDDGDRVNTKELVIRL